tara:strand:+ start:556 stop:693 length:138 start_codon:yes stop_codon:yes gene_type:complete
VGFDNQESLLAHGGNQDNSQSSPRLKFERTYKVTAPAVNAVLQWK